MKKLLIAVLLFVASASVFGQTKCNWSKAGFYYSNRCGTVVFEMGSYIDTCVKYTTWRYNHKTGKLDTIAHDRVFTRTMDTGLYTFKTLFYNKCLKCDTMIYKERVRIDCNTSGVRTFNKREPKLVGIYDMLGRPVANIRKDEIMIYLYDDGSTRKVISK